jgi:hypothetical protein
VINFIAVSTVSQATNNAAYEAIIKAIPVSA